MTRFEELQLAEEKAAALAAKVSLEVYRAAKAKDPENARLAELMATARMMKMSAATYGKYRRRCQEESAAEANAAASPSAPVSSAPALSGLTEEDRRMAAHFKLDLEQYAAEKSRCHARDAALRGGS